MAIKISVDTTQSVVATYGLGDGKYANILSSSLDRASLVDTDSLVKSVVANYRYDFREGEYKQKELTREANAFGKVVPIELPFTYRHEDADRILDYMRKDFIAQSVIQRFSGFKEVALGKNLRIHLDIPSRGINSDWQILGVVELREVYDLVVKMYIASKYTYEASASLPIDETLPVPTVFGSTPPDPVANLTVTGSAVVNSETGTREGILDVSWDAPNDGNYIHSEVSVKENGQPASSYKSFGTGFNSRRIGSLKPNLSYDVKVVSVSPNGTYGLLIEKTNTATGSATSAPSTPATPSAKRSGRSWTFIVVANSASEKIKSYTWEVRTSAGTLVDTIVDAGTEISYAESGTSTVSYKARVKAVNIYGQESSYSAYSTALGNEQWERDHLIDNATMNISATQNASEKPGVSQTQGVWYTVLSISGVAVDSTAIVKARYSGQWAFPGGDGFYVRLKRGSTVLKSFDDFNTADSQPVALLDERSTSAGTYTYTVETMNDVSGGLGLGLVENTLSIQVDYK